MATLTIFDELGEPFYQAEAADIRELIRIVRADLQAGVGLIAPLAIDEPGVFVWFGGVDLRGVDLSNEILWRMKFNEACFDAANLAGADCRWCDFNDARLVDVDFTGADLRYADLHGCDVSGANFTNADLRGAMLYRTNFDDAKMTGANLEGAVLEEDGV